MKILPFLSFGLLFMLFEGQSTVAYAQKTASASSQAQVITQYMADHPVENAYLQFDKPYYAAGDTVYFKAYVVNGYTHRLTKLSSVLNVDFINTAGKIDQSVNLKLDSGLANGDFALPDSLPGGSYRIRAYTQWMRNSGQDDFFDKVVPVLGFKKNHIDIKKYPDQKPDLQFFPEGGILVDGIQSQIAFKAVAADGLGIAVHGKIYDNTGDSVASFASAHLGMGRFRLTPVAGKTYMAKVVYADGTSDEVPLPAASPSGIVLSVNNDALPIARVKIAASPAFFNLNRDKIYTLLIRSGDLITALHCKLDTPVFRLGILKRKLHTGIAVATLLSPDMEPLCERLFFVQRYDALTLHINHNNNTYSTRQKTSIHLHVINHSGEPVRGHFSVAVTDETMVPDGQPYPDNILTHFLLTADLKGYVEQPSYYFSDTSITQRRNLDNLLLTQGYRWFKWKQVLDSTQSHLAYEPERGITIAGQIRNLFNKPLAHGTISLLPLTGGLLSTKSDSQGVFRFTNLKFTGSQKFMLSAVNKKGKNNTKIIYYGDKWGKPEVLPEQQPQPVAKADHLYTAFLANEKSEQQNVSAYLNNKGIMLKQVNIHKKKFDDQYRTQSLAGAGNADQVMHAKQIGQIQGPLVTSLDGRLNGVQFVGSGLLKIPFLTTSLYGGLPHNKPNHMLVVIDGAIVSDDSINFLNANDVETVEVLKYASASIYGEAGGDGVLVITTKQSLGLSPAEIVSEGVLPIKVTGFYKARVFYSPKYDHPGTDNQGTDLRSTIYWQPELTTDKNGNASFDYYNADNLGIYKIIIEGIDDNGNIGRQVYRYKVQ